MLWRSCLAVIFKGIGVLDGSTRDFDVQRFGETCCLNLGRTAGHPIDD
jgi:hypothetical protein